MTLPLAQLSLSGGVMFEFGNDHIHWIDKSPAPRSIRISAPMPSATSSA